MEKHPSSTSRGRLMGFISLFAPMFFSTLIAGCMSIPEYVDRAPMPAPAPVVEAPAPSPQPVAPPPPPPPQLPVAERDQDLYDKIGPVNGAVLTRVFYATNRTRNGRTFGSRLEHVGSGMSYGSVMVSLPENRAKGEIPLKPVYIPYSNDAARKYVLLYPLKSLSKDQFFRNLSDATLGVPKNAAFIYIHGYNNSFDDAARRTGQIAVDLELPVVPVMYSWPSLAHKVAYSKDLNNAEASVDCLEGFLHDFAMNSKAQQIFVIAHSMGNLVTTRAMKSLLQKNPILSSKFTQVILAAPDIDPEIFRVEIAPQFSKLKMPVTIYTSRRDRALMASSIYHTGWKNKPRLGHPDSLADTIDGFDFIDASDIPTNFMGHDYIGSNRKLLSDMKTLFVKGVRASGREGLFGYPMPVPKRWKFP